MDEIVILLIQLLVAVVAYCIGRYVLPEQKNQIQMASTIISEWAEKFVHLAAKKEMTGEEKMDYVCSELQILAKENNVQINEQQIRAVIQLVYDQAKKSGDIE